jgi:hypothetical protein
VSRAKESRGRTADSGSSEEASRQQRRGKQEAEGEVIRQQKISRRGKRQEATCRGEQADSRQQADSRWRGKQTDGQRGKAKGAEVSLNTLKYTQGTVGRLGRRLAVMSLK